MEKVFQTPKVIPDPVKDIQALNWIDTFLKRKNMTGLLIGSLSKRVWFMNKIRTSYLIQKDIDVLILNVAPNDFPGQWEHGVDWWVQTSTEYAPTNGTHVGLLWSLALKDLKELSPGLVVPSHSILNSIGIVENRIQQNKKNACQLSFERKHFTFPVIDIGTVEILLHHKVTTKHPKPA